MTVTINLDLLFNIYSYITAHKTLASIVFLLFILASIVFIGFYFRAIRWLIRKTFNISVEEDENTGKCEAYENRCATTAIAIGIAIISYIPFVMRIFIVLFNVKGDV